MGGRFMVLMFLVNCQFNRPRSKGHVWHRAGGSSGRCRSPCIPRCTSRAVRHCWFSRKRYCNRSFFVKPLRLGFEEISVVVSVREGDADDLSLALELVEMVDVGSRMPFALKHGVEARDVVLLEFLHLVVCQPLIVSSVIGVVVGCHFVVFLQGEGRHPRHHLLQVWPHSRCQQQLCGLRHVSVEHGVCVVWPLLLWDDVLDAVDVHRIATGPPFLCEIADVSGCADEKPLLFLPPVGVLDGKLLCLGFLDDAG